MAAAVPPLLGGHESAYRHADDLARITPTDDVGGSVLTHSATHAAVFPSGASW